MCTLRFFALLTFLLLGLTACTNEPDSNDYFPLNKGFSWEYQFQLNTTSKKQHSGTYSVTNLGTTNLDTQKLIKRRTNNGRDYYLQKKDDGIYRIASRTLFESEPIIDSPPRMVLPLPYLNNADQRWSSSSTSYVIHRDGPSTISDANPTKDFVMSYHIASQTETVIVPAGKFENCLLIEGNATLTLFADPHKGFQDIPIKTLEWYAPGVGLVKLERTEPLDSRVFKGGSIIFKLLRFKS